MDGADIFSVTGAIGGAGHIFSLAYFRPPLAILVSITLRLWTARPPTSLAESAQKPSGECLTGRRGVGASLGPIAYVSTGFAGRHFARSLGHRSRKRRPCRAMDHAVGSEGDLDDVDIAPGGGDEY